MRNRLCLFLACAFVALAGCGPSVPQVKLDEARSLVQECLETWKKGGKPVDLKTLPRPIDFSDDLWAKGNALTSYEIQKTYYDARYKIIRCAASLTLRDRRGKEMTEKAVYDVKLEPKILIAHQPLP